MPTKAKKSPPKRKPTPKVKAKAPPKKPVLKAVKGSSKPAPPMKGKKPTSHSSLLRQILEARNHPKGAPPPQPFMNHRGSQPPPGKHQQFARFAGPRRRAA